jgi:hypothetical protein
MNDRLIAYAAAQIWQVPFIVLYVLGVIFAVNRRDIGKASSYAAFGFGALALAQILGSLFSYLMMEARFDGSHDAMRMASMATAFFIPRTLLEFGGIGLVMAAIFAKRPAANPSRL